MSTANKNSSLVTGHSPAVRAGGRRIPAAHPKASTQSEHQKEEAQLLKQDLLEHKQESMEHQKYEIEAAKQTPPRALSNTKAIASNYQAPAQRVTRSTNKKQNHQLNQPGKLKLSLFQVPLRLFSILLVTNLYVRYLLQLVCVGGNFSGNNFLH
jgi:hypothetical protein